MGMQDIVANAPIDTVGDIPAPPAPAVALAPAPAPAFKMPKTEFKQGIFDPAIANSAQKMFAMKKGPPPTGPNGMSPPSTTPDTTDRGGKPGGTPK
jgi:hypothetical protein